jgi:hypothetical protein
MKHALLTLLWLLAIPLCTMTKLDGLGGFVWKPSGAHFPHNAVVVLPSKYAGVQASVAIQDAKGNTLAVCPLKSDGVCKPGQTECLGRPTYLCSHSGGTLGKAHRTVYVRVRTSKRCDVWTIRHPERRAD